MNELRGLIGMSGGVKPSGYAMRRWVSEDDDDHDHDRDGSADDSGDIDGALSTSRVHEAQASAFTSSPTAAADRAAITKTFSANAVLATSSRPPRAAAAVDRRRYSLDAAGDDGGTLGVGEEESNASARARFTAYSDDDHGAAAPVDTNASVKGVYGGGGGSGGGGGGSGGGGGGGGGDAGSRGRNSNHIPNNNHNHQNNSNNNNNSSNNDSSSSNNNNNEKKEPAILRRLDKAAERLRRVARQQEQLNRDAAESRQGVELLQAATKLASELRSEADETDKLRR
jgi:hypothetical protein